MDIINKLRRSLVAAGVSLSLLAILGFASPVWASVGETETTPAADIVDTAISAGSFKTLAAALQAAGLVDTLKGSGPFTVFAPTDAAFAKLPAGTVESLLRPENKEQLKSILLYHVVSGSVKADQVVKLNGKYVKTLQGSSVKVATADGVKVDKARVTQTDIIASNGVIHVIDTVLMPKAKGSN